MKGGRAVRVAWDARVMLAPDLRGMGQYSLHLLHALLRVAPELEFYLFHDHAAPARVPAGTVCRRARPTRGYRWQIWERVSLPLASIASRASLLHSPANTTPPRSAMPRVVTVHDVIPFLPGIGDPPPLPYFRDVVPRAVATADAILTDSLCSKRDICRVFGIAADRVRVVPLAPGPDVARPEAAQREARLARLGVTRPYVLALGAPARRKNTAGVLKAFARVHASAGDCRLVLSGVPLSYRDAVRNLAAAEGLGPDCVRMFGFVPQEELWSLYAGCAAFLFLSLYEGFGLPILEAMTCGAPVVCSNRASCPEVAGDAAIVVDPEDPEMCRDAVLSLLDSAEEADRRRAAGVARAAAFSWTATANETYRVYRELAGA